MNESKPNAKKTLVLLDAHAILHRAYHALPDFTSPKGEPTGALYGVVAMLLKIVEELKPDYIAACYDLPEPTYRHDAYEDYKATRTKTDDALVDQIDRSRDIFAAFGVPIYEHVGFEADDVLGTIAEQMRTNKDLTVIIASGDMDTLQLVDKKRVQVYTLRKGIKDTIIYDEKRVNERFGFGPEKIPDYKGLRGDPSDNIPGIVGIGEKIATELITQFGGIEDIYKKLKKNEDSFLEKGIKPRIVNLLKDNEEEAEFSKMLATIRLDVPISYEVPTETWRERLDLEVILSLFSELGFRTLAIRVKELFGEDDESDETLTDTGERIPEAELTEAAIGLWLLESDTTNPTYEDILAYGRSHNLTGGFAEIKDKIFKTLKAEKLESVFKEIEWPLVPVVKSMEERGIKLDKAYLKRLSKKLHQELGSKESAIYKLASSEFNINSPKQLGEVLFDSLGLKPKNQKRTATGQRTTKESELEKMREDHPIIAEILRYRELQKLLSTYIDNIPDLVGKDGRLHAKFLQCGTTTGRMSSQHPNLQNIPTRTSEGRAIRQGFVAAEGYQLVAIDYSQIELRIAAILSGDKKLIDIFKRGEDVHRGVAIRVFNVDADNVTAEMRRRAKIINFGILYGMGVNALRANLGGETPRAEAQEFLNAYFNTFTRLAEYLEETKDAVRKDGFTTTYFGRRRYFPGINSVAPFIRAQAERMAINAPIQGTSADITKLAMVRTHNYLKDKKQLDDVRLLLQVHDELVFEIKTSLVEKILPQIQALMTEDMIKAKDSQGVPLRVEAKLGANWEEMKPWGKV